MNSNLTIKELSNLLISFDDIVIYAHQKPDGDAIGASLALQSAYKAIGKRAVSYFEEPLPDKYSKFATTDTYFKDLPNWQNIKNCIVVDTGNIDRIALFSKINLPLINIDHHPDNHFFGLQNYVNSDACATSEIIFNIINFSTKWKMTAKVADSLLFGILMDTGGLRFANTNANVLKIASVLIESGADYHAIIKDLYFSEPLNLIKLQAELISNNLQLKFNSKFAYIYASDEILKKYGMTTKNIEGLIDSIRIIEGLSVAAIITDRDDFFKVSLRSCNNDIPVNGIAQKLSGGGHRLAAGCSIQAKTFAEAEKILLEHIAEILK